MISIREVIDLSKVEYAARSMPNAMKKACAYATYTTTKISMNEPRSSAAAPIVLVSCHGKSERGHSVASVSRD